MRFTVQVVRPQGGDRCIVRPQGGDRCIVGIIVLLKLTQR